MIKLKGLSLFANVGVAEAGIESNDNIKILLANEIDHKRAMFYYCVHPETEMIEGDIRNIPSERFADKKQTYRKRCDLIILCKNKAGHILKAIN